MRKRAELLAHIQNTNSQYNLPEIGKKIAYKAHRDGVAERFPDPAVQKSIAVDLALIGHDDQLLRDVELSILTTAKQHNAQTLYLLRTVPGIGEILSLVLLYEIHDIARFPRVQTSSRIAASSRARRSRLGSGTGPRARRSATPISSGPSRKWPCFSRANPAGQKYLTTLEKKNGSGKALTLLGQKLGRTVYDMLQRQTAFDMGKFLNGEGSGAEEPNASLDHHGLSLRVVLCKAYFAASLNM